MTTRDRLAMYCLEKAAYLLQENREEALLYLRMGNLAVNGDLDAAMDLESEHNFSKYATEYLHDWFLDTHSE